MRRARFTPWHSRFGVLFALKLDRDIAAIVSLTQDARDAFVIQIQRVPFTTAVVSWPARRWCGRSSPVYRILQKLPVSINTPSQGLRQAFDPQQSFRRRAPHQHFQRHVHPASRRPAFFNRVNTPLKSVFIDHSRELPPLPRLAINSSMICSVPAAGVQPDARNTQLMRQLHTMDGVINILLPIRRLRSHESLMNGQATSPTPFTNACCLSLCRYSTVH